MPIVIDDIAAMCRAAHDHRRGGRRIAVVPTMGALHEGHLRLIRTARSLADVVVTTIFVNPAQFGQGEDFDRYPRDGARDAGLAGGAGTDIVFTPLQSAMYPPGYRTWVDVTGLDALLEGRSRPGHFRGVATVVLKLFAATAPDIAVFGQKDAQQVVILRRMVRDLDLGIEMIVVPTVREPDGLALSSRNAYLSPDERREVVAGMRAMIAAGSGGVIDYISIADAETLEELPSVHSGRSILVSLAVRFGTTRLIDNIPMVVP
jgi:pantoate--beta-alanine ligase